MHMSSLTLAQQNPLFTKTISIIVLISRLEILHARCNLNLLEISLDCLDFHTMVYLATALHVLKAAVSTTYSSNHTADPRNVLHILEELYLRFYFDHLAGGSERAQVLMSGLVIEGCVASATNAGIFCGSPVHMAPRPHTLTVLAALHTLTVLAALWQRVA